MPRRRHYHAASEGDSGDQQAGGAANDGPTAQGGGSLLNAALYMGTHKVNETVPLRFFTIAELTERQAGARPEVLAGIAACHQISVFVG
jgi:hypothetical protein